MSVSVRAVGGVSSGLMPMGRGALNLHMVPGMAGVLCLHAVLLMCIRGYRGRAWHVLTVLLLLILITMLVMLGVVFHGIIPVCVLLWAGPCMCARAEIL
jgi:hypothetical protein